MITVYTIPLVAPISGKSKNWYSKNELFLSPVEFTDKTEPLGFFEQYPEP